MTHGAPPWFHPHRKQLDAVIVALDLILANQQRLLKMSESVDQAVSELTALAQAESAKLTQLQTDVTAALARIQSGTLNAEQQAAVDALKASMTANTTAIDAIDASTQPPPAP